MGGHAGQMDPAGGVLDEEQHVQANAEHRIDVEKSSGDNAGGLGGEELLPGGARRARCGAKPSSGKDHPYRGGRDLVAQSFEFTA
jgi:hypothetical protein